MMMVMMMMMTVLVVLTLLRGSILMDDVHDALVDGGDDGTDENGGRAVKLSVTLKNIVIMLITISLTHHSIDDTN